MSAPNNTVRLAVAAILAGTACGAHALDLSAYSSSTAVNVYLSGSTAIDNTLTNTAIETDAPGGLCQANSIDIYYVGTTSTYSNRLIFCTGSSTSGVSGQPLAIFKESTAGSANAVTPLISVAQGGLSGLSFINPTVLTDAACPTSATVAATASTSAYTAHSGCAIADESANVVPTGGFADVEAAILKSVTGATINAAAASTYLTASPTVDQVWALLVTKNLYYALQTAEGMSSCTATNGVDSPLCAPTLSKQQVGSLLSLDIYSWTQLGLSNTSGAKDNNVYLCRRDYASGTEASFEAYFTGERCSKSSVSVPGEDGAQVWAAGSAGGVRTCMYTFYAGGPLTSYYNQDGSYTSGGATNPYTATEAGNQWAVGFNNTEITNANLTATYPSGASDSFRVVAIDGVLPQLANVINGFYPYFSTGNAYQIAAGKTGAPSGNALTAWNAIKKFVGQPTFTSDSNQNYTGRPWGPSGDVSPAGLYAATNAPNIPETNSGSGAAESNPTNAFTKTSSGVINNCDVPVFDSGDLPKASVEYTLLGTGVVNPN